MDLHPLTYRFSAASKWIFIHSHIDSNDSEYSYQQVIDSAEEAIAYLKEMNAQRLAELRKQEQEKMLLFGGGATGISNVVKVVKEGTVVKEG